MNKQPQVTERTKAVLCKAFWSLYTTQSIEQISVRQITDIAGYNRGTFYLYYRDVYDMLQQIEASLFGKLDGLVQSLTQSTAHYNITSAFEEVLQFMAAQRNYITVLLGTHAEQFAAARCSAALWNIISTHRASHSQQDQQAPLTEQELDMLRAFVTQGLLGCIVHWLQMQSSEGQVAQEAMSAGELARYIVQTLIPAQLL